MLRKLSEVGSRVDESYMLYVNNDEPVRFETKDAAFKYLSDYRDNNVIFNLGVYRIETYSL